MHYYTIANANWGTQRSKGETPTMQHPRNDNPRENHHEFG